MRSVTQQAERFLLWEIPRHDPATFKVLLGVWSTEHFGVDFDRRIQVRALDNAIDKLRGRGWVEKYRPDGWPGAVAFPLRLTAEGRAELRRREAKQPDNEIASR